MSRELLWNWSTPRSDHSRATMALVLAGMSAAASVIGLLTFLFPQVPIPDRPFQISITLLGLPNAALLLVLRRRFGERLPAALFHGGLAFSAVMICLGSWSARTSPTAIASTAFFVWLGLYVGSFFPLRQVVLHLAWIAACLSVLLTVNGNTASAAVGVMTFGIVLAATGASYFLSMALARAAGTDSLTGLPNRQTLDANLDRELSRCERGGSTLSVGIVDIDRFKEINDAGGHLAGDAELVSLATQWKSHLRGVDLIARYGGDEFVLVMPGCGTAQALSTFERLQRLDAPRCSVGVTEWVPGDTRVSLLERADRALYAAKDGGRDRVVAAPLPADAGVPA